MATRWNLYLKDWNSDAAQRSAALKILFEILDSMGRSVRTGQAPLYSQKAQTVFFFSTADLEGVLVPLNRSSPLVNLQGDSRIKSSPQSFSQNPLSSLFNDRSKNLIPKVSVPDYAELERSQLQVVFSYLFLDGVKFLQTNGFLRWSQERLFYNYEVYRDHALSFASRSIQEGGSSKGDLGFKQQRHN